MALVSTAKGIGLTTTKLFLENNCRVAMIYCDEDKSQKVSAVLQAHCQFVVMCLLRIVLLK